MLFSVILATRDRPGLFEEALASVCAQTFAGTDAQLEIIVVNDGTAAAHLPAYEAIWQAARDRLGTRFQVHTLVHRPKGHGQSYSLNYGVAQAQGDYVCFLDDDDKWTDAQHLNRAAQCIAAAAQQGEALDLYMANQDAWTDQGERVGTLWLGELAGHLTAQGRQPDAQGVYAPTVAELMSTTGFCHLNCLTVRRALFNTVGGMDEGIRWECDRDLYLKLVEAARCIRHHPAVVSYHRVPDPRKANNMTTTLGMLDKRLLQAIVLDRALIRSRHPDIRRHARTHKRYALQKMAEAFATQGDWVQASHFARLAAGLAPHPAWLAFTLKCMLRAVGQR